MPCKAGQNGTVLIVFELAWREEPGSRGGVADSSVDGGGAAVAGCLARFGRRSTQPSTQPRSHLALYHGDWPDWSRN
jgi:hypothetical protein